MKFLTFVFILLCQYATASDHFNILIYHHVSESTPASTSVSPAKFREHLQFFKDNGFTVVDLEQALNAVQTEAALPENTIAITFDDGYNNIYENAWPLLKEFNYPFTIFVATDPIDKHFGDMLTWDQIRELHSAGVTIANHSSDHGYLVRHRVRDELWLNQIKSNIIHAQERLKEEVGEDIPTWFAYPYGEFNSDLQGLLADLGYIGFAQHSGGVWRDSNFLSLPRFAAAGIYANTATLKTKLMSHPMPIDESLLPDMLTNSVQPTVIATLKSTDDLTKALNCFVDGTLESADWQSETVFKLTSTDILGEGRHRYNCTSQSKTGDFYYWFSKPWLVYKNGK